jgi:DNA-binding protein H-NS
MALKSMSIDKLVELKNRVETALASKVIDQRRSLETELSKLGRLQGATSRGKSALGRGGARGSVAPKYRNPENASETWAGRGLKPRWLSAAIKAVALSFLIMALYYKAEVLYASMAKHPRLKWFESFTRCMTRFRKGTS